MPTLKDRFFDNHPLLVSPLLATAIGRNEAIVLQQTHSWAMKHEQDGRNFEDGFYRTYNSYPKWQQQFPFFSERTVRRSFALTEALGPLVAGSDNVMRRDRTKGYRVDYARLGALRYDEESGKLADATAGDATSHLARLTRPIRSDGPDASVKLTRTMWSKCPHRYQGLQQTLAQRLLLLAAR